MNTLFISDLHLHASRPAASNAFLALLRGASSSTEHLYILGDLFEAWIGDDAPDAHDREIMDGLLSATSAGLPVSFIRGNRDFLIGERFARETGVSVLSDSSLITLGGQPVLLMHGDTLCTDDHDYQRFRRTVRKPWVQSLFLALPRSLRSRLAGRARSASTASQADKPPEIMDVNDGAVAEAFRASDVGLMIHGHTHRPACHELTVDDRQVQRWVLGDWYEQGSVLTFDGSKLELSQLKY